MPRGTFATDPDRLNNREAKALAAEIEAGCVYTARVEYIAQGISVVDVTDLATDQTTRLRCRADWDRLAANGGA